jgi:DNA-binding NtrC family response regulator
VRKTGAIIKPEHLSPELKRTSSPTDSVRSGSVYRLDTVVQFAGGPGGTLADALAEVERRMISDALRRHGGNISRACARTWINRVAVFISNSNVTP